MKQLLIALSISIVLLSCGPAAKLDGFDATVWKEDAGGCKGTRATMAEVFKTQGSKIEGLDEGDVTKLLGKPDGKELYVRSQKFLIYYLEPSPDCKNGKPEPLTLKIRFNALGYSNEVFLENL